MKYFLALLSIHQLHKFSAPIHMNDSSLFSLNKKSQSIKKNMIMGKREEYKFIGNNLYHCYSLLRLVQSSLDTFSMKNCTLYAVLCPKCLKSGIHRNLIGLFNITFA